MPDWIPINWGLISNPINWIIVVLMISIASVFVSLILGSIATNNAGA